MNTPIAAMIAVLAMTSAAVAAPAGATKPHHARHVHHQTLSDAPFDMQACLKGAEPLYASPEERKAVCNDMRAGV
jgi:hypothetical protein